MNSADADELRRENDELHDVVAQQKREIARLNNELRRADVLKSQFLSTISHELRTPLTTIVGFSTMLLRGRPGEPPSERQRDNAQRILSAARQLSRLINDVLDLSRMEAGRLDIFRREVDLGALLRDLCAEMEPEARSKGLALRLDVDAGEGLERVVTDADRVWQIMANLLHNAIKFTEQGVVTVRAERGRESIQITVQDTGAGIAPEEAQRVFDEFYQVDQSNTRGATGAGLGLTVAQRLAGLLSGRLTLHSVQGEGTIMTLVLPAGADDRPVSGAAPVVGSAHNAASTRILVIDDDPQVVVLVERALEGTPFEVSGALSGDEGLRKARALRPAAILLDVKMPETDGWRILYRLKSDPAIAEIPVVMHSIVADRALGLSLGATEYLVKPVERDQLLGVLSRLTPLGAGPILVVDDDDEVRALLSEGMAQEGYAVAPARTGEEALRVAAEQRPRLIVLDLMMPGMDGFEVLHRLRAEPATRHIPVVVVTAKALTPDESEALSHDASQVIAKNGVPVRHLLHEIQEALVPGRMTL